MTSSRTKSLRTPSNMMVVSLAFSDFCMINAVGPPLFINVFMGKYWAFGVLGCELYGFLGGVFGEFIHAYPILSTYAYGYA